MRKKVEDRILAILADKEIHHKSEFCIEFSPEDVSSALSRMIEQKKVREIPTRNCHDCEGEVYHGKYYAI